MRRNKIDIISDILRICMPGACKTKIVYAVNLNFKTINPYLDILTDKGMIVEVDATDPGHFYRYETTEKGKAILENLEIINKDLLQPLSQAC